MKYPKKVTVIELENAPFRCAKDAVAYAKSHGIVGVMSDADTGGKGEISNVEVLKGNAAPVARPSDKTSTFDVSILLKDVRDVNGVLLIGENKPK